MPKSNMLMLIPSIYASIYLILLLLEIVYIFLIWSKYGEPDGMFHKMYQFIRNNLSLYVMFNIVYLSMYSFIFPGIGWLAFTITLWRVADMCCNKENFSNISYNKIGPYYPYCPNTETIFNHAYLERQKDGTEAGYSSAVGDTYKPYSHKCTLKQYADMFERLHRPRPLYTTSLLSKEMKSS